MSEDKLFKFIIKVKNKHALPELYKLIQSDEAVRKVLTPVNTDTLLLITHEYWSYVKGLLYTIGTNYEKGDIDLILIDSPIKDKMLINAISTLILRGFNTVNKTTRKRVMFRDILIRKYGVINGARVYVVQFNLAHNKDKNKVYSTYVIIIKDKQVAIKPYKSIYNSVYEILVDAGILKPSVREQVLFNAVNGNFQKILKTIRNTSTSTSPGQASIMNFIQTKRKLTKPVEVKIHYYNKTRNDILSSKDTLGAYLLLFLKLRKTVLNIDKKGTITHIFEEITRFREFAQKEFDNLIKGKYDNLLFRLELMKFDEIASHYASIKFSNGESVILPLTLLIRYGNDIIITFPFSTNPSKRTNNLSKIIKRVYNNLGVDISDAYYDESVKITNYKFNPRIPIIKIKRGVFPQPPMTLHYIAQQILMEDYKIITPQFQLHNGVLAVALGDSYYYWTITTFNFNTVIIQTENNTLSITDDHIIHIIDRTKFEKIYRENKDKVGITEWRINNMLIKEIKFPIKELRFATIITNKPKRKA